MLRVWPAIILYGLFCHRMLHFLLTVPSKKWVFFGTAVGCVPVTVCHDRVSTTDLSKYDLVQWLEHIGMVM